MTRWIKVIDKNEPHALFRKKWYCPDCGMWQTYGETRYCMNCGALMETKGEDNE